MNRSPLFDDIDRIDTGPAKHSEPSFDYLNRSGRLTAQKVRNLLDQWFARLPDDAKAELQGRFRSSDDHQHFSAFFELYMHQLLLSLGFTVELHPRLRQAETTHPDYLAQKSGRRLFYLEATIAGMSKEQAAAKARENVVYDTLEQMYSPNFFLYIELGGCPATPPPGAKMRGFLERKLGKLDPDEVAARYETGGFDALPAWHFEHDGWDVTFRPIPKKADARGKPGIRPIGTWFYKPRLVASHVGIRNSIGEKATRYGELDLPFVVAVSVMDPFCDRGAIADGLLGQESLTFVRGPEGCVVRSYAERIGNGAWYGPSGPQNTRVSAALVVVELFPWTIAKVIPMLWHNPWARLPLRPNIWPLAQLVPDHEKGGMLERQGIDVAELLRVGPNWPDDDQK